DVIVALKPGLLPARLERPNEPTPGDTGWPDPLVLQLGGEPLSIEGQVLGPDGKPRPGLRVWIADPTPFGLVGRVPLTVARVLPGETLPPQILAEIPEAEAKDGDDFWDFETRAGPSSAFWSYVRTDAQGLFELRGLIDRKYRLTVMDDTTLQRHVTE